LDGVGGWVGVQVGVRVGVWGVGETIRIVGENEAVRVKVTVGDRLGEDFCRFPSDRESEKTPMSKVMETRAMTTPQKTCRAECILIHFFQFEFDRQQDAKSGAYPGFGFDPNASMLGFNQ
jgi:hypothetical protein